MADEPIVDENLSDEDKQKENKSKDKKKFDEAIKFVSQLVGGVKNLKPAKKVGGSDAANLVAQLFKEERQALHAEFVNSLKELLKQHVAMEGEIAKKQKELDELTAKKQKEFTQAVNNWKNKVEQADIMNDTYVSSLQTAFTTPDTGEKK
jgi:uncharacterized protein with gpF-like domain